MITRSNSSQVSKLEHVRMNNVNVKCSHISIYIYIYNIYIYILYVLQSYLFLDETTTQEQQDY